MKRRDMLLLLVLAIGLGAVLALRRRDPEGVSGLSVPAPSLTDIRLNTDLVSEPRFDL